MSDEEPYCCAQCIATDRVLELLPLLEKAGADDITGAVLELARLIGCRVPLGQQMTDVLLRPPPERAAREVARRAQRIRHGGGHMIRL